MTQLLIFASTSIVLLGGHILAYYLLQRLLIINEGNIILICVLSFLFLSILISSFLIHKLDNGFTRNYYYFSSIWVGILVNLGVMAAIVLLARPILSSFGLSLSLIQFRAVFLIGVVILSGFGLYRAYYPRIKSYEVYINDLPDSWDGKKVAHLSDVHLGPIYREKFLARIIKKTNSINPEAVFITGDLFDGMEANFSWLDDPLKNFKSEKGIYYGFGNHDLYLGFDRAKKILKDKNVIFLDDKLVEVDGLQIIGINYTFETDSNLEKDILRHENYRKDKPNILLFHTPKNIKLSKEVGIDLQLSGHTHDGQLFPFNFPAKWMHKGYGYGLFEEDDFSLIVNGGVGTWGPPMRTTARAEIIEITLRNK
ncbi:MAG: metallophosphoesterase [Patescibacteria group bacterium]|jgi:predicted MPP superfamily phosphohydrolase|nr:metallophosphoesterase [Patescibacteria group bacterium]